METQEPAEGRPAAGALAQAVASLLWLAQAALLALGVQRLAEGAGARLLAPASGVLLLGLLRAALDAWGGQRQFEQARALLSRLRRETVEALAARSPLDRERPASGLAASLLAEQAEAVVPWLARYRAAQTRVRLVTPAVLLVVLSQSWAAALILLVALPLIPLFMALVGWRARAASQEQMVELGRMNAFLLDRLRGLSTLRALDAAAATATRVRASAELLRERSLRVLRIAFLSSAALELFAALGVALVAVYVGFHLLGPLAGVGAWSGRLSLGQGLFVLMLAPAFFEPLRELSAVWHDKAAGEAALALLREHRAAGVPLPGGAAPAAAAPCSGPAHVTVRGLKLRRDDAALFTGLDLELRPGERVALVGASGTGKSTLLALLAGLLPADAGTIRIDGRLLDDTSAAALRGRIAWIGQQPHVFAGTVLHNVGLGRASREQAERALALAGLGAETGRSLGEGGAGLSGGEQLRLALARAAARPGTGLLLVDEPTAHLDPVSAAQVTAALLRLAEGRTLLVATHDPALIARMDRRIALPAAAVTAPVRERIQA